MDPNWGQKYLLRRTYLWYITKILLMQWVQNRITSAIKKNFRKPQFVDTKTIYSARCFSYTCITTKPVNISTDIYCLTANWSPYPAILGL